MIDFSKIPSPAYVIEEKLLRKNLSLIKSVQEQAGIKIILAFKAFAMWKSFPIIREYVNYSAASSAWEARLALEKMGSKAHTYSPAYTEEEFPVIKSCSSHITFNSISQFYRFYKKTLNNLTKISCGLRINPEYSEVRTSLYNPVVSGSRLGITREELGNNLPEGIEGLHFHTLFESNSYALENTLNHVEDKFGDLFSKIKWLNMGGGHLITQENYSITHLIELLQNFRKKYPHLQIILEPGAAFVWQTGVLVSSVVDIVKNNRVETAILNISFTCHMPDCLEMPYQPRIRGALQKVIEGKPTYRMGGNSCLSGDFIGDWSFNEELKIGDKIIFEDMIHYTVVKTTMFNGIPHPDIYIWKTNDKLEIYRKFNYDDYKNRMS
ncbi:MAG: carboxynorspermidine decarboxylase [Bacteroidales bacterium OttesenSCG-928-I14]|jgi:carboxynorspermidine decarboxylase|nr:carboxynorspermidine decarboxylase [Bacteroidales bacterium OttesenSCG-928-I14]